MPSAHTPYTVPGGTNTNLPISRQNIVHSLKEKTSQTDQYLVNLSSETYVFEDKLTRY